MKLKVFILQHRKYIISAWIGFFLATLFNIIFLTWQFWLIIVVYVLIENKKVGIYSTLWVALSTIYLSTPEPIITSVWKTLVLISVPLICHATTVQFYKMIVEKLKIKDGE